MLGEAELSRLISVLRRRVVNDELLKKVAEASKALSKEDLYYYIIGLSFTYHVPLTAKDLAEIKEILGLE
jgi:hypothetical protein